MFANSCALSSILARLLSEALDLVIPVQCPGCGVWGEVLCERCAAQARREKRVGYRALNAGRESEGNVPLVFLGEYEGVLRRIIIAAKHAPRFDASDFLLEAGRGLGRTCAGLLGGSANTREEEVWVVPAPSSLARRMSGARVVSTLAVGVAQGVAAGGIAVRFVEAVRMRVTASSQAGRGGAARRRSRRGTMVVSCPIPSAVKVVLVDDVLTTGATMAELIRCVGRVDSCAVLAEATAQNDMA